MTLEQALAAIQSVVEGYRTTWQEHRALQQCLRVVQAAALKGEKTKEDSSNEAPTDEPSTGQ